MQEKPFSQRVKLTNLFNTTRKLLEEDKPIPARAKSEQKDNRCEHDKAWKPSKPLATGVIKMTLAKFPEHMPNPEKALTRKRPVEGEPEPKPSFRLTYRRKTAPCQSVCTNLRNLKISFPSIFRK